MDVEQIGRRIRGFRKLKGYTQVEFAKAIQISAYILGSIERGKKQPTEAILKKICEALHISQNELMITNETEREDG